MSAIESTNSFSYPATGRGAQDSEQDSAEDSAIHADTCCNSTSNAIYANLETSSREEAIKRRREEEEEERYSTWCTMSTGFNPSLGAAGEHC